MGSAVNTCVLCGNDNNILFFIKEALFNTIRFETLFLYLMLILILYTLIFTTSFSIYINTLLLVGFYLF